MNFEVKHGLDISKMMQMSKSLCDFRTCLFLFSGVSDFTLWLSGADSHYERISLKRTELCGFQSRR